MNMCEYCEGKKDLAAFRVFNGNLPIKICGQMIQLIDDEFCSDHPDDSPIMGESEINYCPMCGKKLGGEDE